MQLNELPQRWLGLHRAIGVSSAMSGWLYALAVGRDFLLTEAEWAQFTLESSCQEPVTSPSCQSTHSSLPHQGHNNQYRIVILGAGPVGMRLAIELKKSLGRDIQVQLLEHRVSPEGLPLPYNRAWPINIHKSVLGADAICLSDEGVDFLPWTLCDLEAYLFRLAVQCGCEFVHTRKPTHEVLRDIKPHLVFDATGGRWQRHGEVTCEKPVVLLDEDLQQIHGYASFAIHPRRVSLEDKDSLCFAIFESGYVKPLVNGVPMATWMLKIRGVPQHVGAELVKQLHGMNSDNWAFVWPTRLKTGEWLVMLGLRHAERNVLKQHLQSSTPLHLAYQALSRLPDPRWKILLDQLVLSHDIENSSCYVETPFLWKPELFLGTEESLLPNNGYKAIPVGDSLFHGHPHVGNGLAAHLHMVNMLLPRRNS